METNQAQKTKIPYPSVTPYLTVNGADKLINFLRQAFDAVELERHLNNDGSIMHAEMGIGDSMLMISEASDRYPAMPTMIYLHLSESDTYFQRAVEAGVTVIMEPSDQEYGDRMGGVKDFAGNQWWIASSI